MQEYINLENIWKEARKTKRKKRGKKRKEQKIDQIRKVKNWKMKEKRKEKSVNVQCAINDPTLTKYCVGKKHQH